MSRGRAPLPPTAILLVAALLASCGGARATEHAPVADAPDPAATTAVPPSPEPELVPTVAWEPCDAPFECATLSVPLDHAAPDGEHIDLALIRLPAPAAARRIGSLVVNPGGPGASGVDFVRSAAIDVLPAEIRARFDIVGFDPRGVGASRPISCGDDGRAFLAVDLTPQGPAEVDAVLTAAETFAASCTAADAGLLPHVGTGEVARDLDAIRVALGDHRLSYLGYSYGTRIGATYADLFPDRVRALVLDGAVDPQLDLVGEARASARTLETALGEFLTTCASDPRCALPAERATLGAFDDLLAALDAEGLPAGQLGPGVRLRPGQAAVAVLALLRDRATWPVLEVALAEAWQGDGSWLAATVGEADTGDTDIATGLAPLMAVNCRDVPAPTAADLPELAASLAAESPRFGAVSLLLHAPCSFWPAPADALPLSGAATGSGPIVVVGNRGDLITPFAWSERLAEQLDEGVLLTRDGDRHTAFGGGNVCTDRAVVRYLVDLIPPDPARSCG